MAITTAPELAQLDTTTIYGEFGAPAIAWYRQPDWRGEECWEAASADDSLDDLWRSLGPRWKPAGDLETPIAQLPTGKLAYWTVDGVRVEVTR